MNDREIVVWLLRLAHALLERVPGYWTNTQETIEQVIDEVWGNEH